MNRGLALGLAIVLAGAGCRSVVLSRYGTRTGIGREHGGNPEFRRKAHRGVDFRADQRGAPVLAAASGFVAMVSDDAWGNTSVVLWHRQFDRFTRYYYRGSSPVVAGNYVRRGEPLGEIAAQPPKGDGLAYVHLELCVDWTCDGEGALGGTEDPLAIADGCFRAGASYPRDRLVLTYPVGC